MRARLTTWAEDHDVELIFFEPPSHFDAAIVGLVHGHGQDPAVLYDEGKVLAALAREGMSAEDAEEWFEYNTLGTSVGPATPRFLMRREEF